MTECQNCGAPVQPGDSFCPSCGADLRNHPQAGQQQQPTGQRPQQGQQSHSGQRSSGQPPAQPRQSPGQAGQQSQGQSRRELLKYGAVGALAVGGAGGAWFVFGGDGQTVVDDFETGLDEWYGNMGAFDTTTDAMSGSSAARLAFDGGSEVWRSVPKRQPNEISFWWQTGAVDDNEFTVWFHELAEEEEPAMENACFGFEVGAGNSSGVVTAPPFKNLFTFETLLDDPQPGTWYETRFSDIDFTNNTFRIDLLDQDGTAVGTVDRYAFDGDPDGIDAVYIRNHMNYTRAAAYLDEFVMQ